MAVVIDTNVAVVAEGLTEQADDNCVDECIDRLSRIIQAGGLLLDEGDAIIREYMGALGHAGQPGVGRVFVKWAFNHRFDGAKCILIRIQPRNEDDWRRFEEFPDSEALAQFDPDDQKFVAVALTSGMNPPILNAVDSGWWQHRDQLASEGVRIEFLCPQHMPAGT